MRNVKYGWMSAALEALGVLVLVAVFLEFLRPGVVVGTVNLLAIIAIWFLAMVFLALIGEETDRRVSWLAMASLGVILLVVHVSLELKITMMAVLLLGIATWRRLYKQEKL